MTRATQNKLYRTFVKGLITEASELTYPENASIDEDNCVIFRKGNRSRRLGLDYQAGSSLSSYSIPAATVDNYAISEYRWQAVANIDGLNFHVQQVGLTLHFYDLSYTPLSSGVKSFTVDLSTYLRPGYATNPGSYEVSLAGGKGYLFVVGAQIEPILVEYTLATDTLASQKIYIQVRDFKGVNDGLANDEEPTTLSNLHAYNLQNQGWVDPSTTGAVTTQVQFFDFFGQSNSYYAPGTGPITTYFTAFSRYPGNNKQWWVAKNGTDDFDATLLSKFYVGNNRAPRGHYILNAFYKDRTAASGVATIPVESTAERPLSVSFFSGRVWYVCNSTVYYTQVLDDKRQAGMCYQEADPTSETISDLIATDGGEIPIPEMTKGTRLFPIGNGILVFATNGLWYVSGTNSGFTATDITVAKVSSIGTTSPNSIVEAGGAIFWWSNVGIQTLAPKSGAFGSLTGVFDSENISETTIQSFYFEDIPSDSKPYVKGYHDPATNTIQWLFNDGSTGHNYFYNRLLNLDLTLQAFYPWTISSSPTTPFVVGLYLSAETNEATLKPSFFRYVTAVPSSSNYVFNFAAFTDGTFADWKTFQGSTGYAFNSYVETGYELLEDAMRDKQTQWVFCYFRRTEDQYVLSGSEYILAHPSSCYFQVKWDWASSSMSNRYSTKIQAYRLTHLPPFDVSNLAVDTGFPIVVTKNKVRGHGKAIQFRFENNEIGSNFDLLGWAVNYSGNTNP